MSKREKAQVVIRARSEIARTMVELRKMRDHASPSEWKQAAEIIVELGKLRDRLEHFTL